LLVNGERALAYVVSIDEIQPLEGYDRVEYARTNGWWCIIGKADGMKVGDKAVYFEVDSKVPSTDKRFEFLEKRNYKIKTQKMCKVYSQGLLMPLSAFPELGDAKVGTDVTKKLNITYADPEDNVRKGTGGDPNAKYKSMAARHQKLFKSKPVRWLMRRKWGKKLMFAFFGRKKDKPKGFPSFVAKTDEERCLTGNSKVYTSDGLLRIADIVNKEVSTNVLSYNDETGDLEYKPIVGYQKLSVDGETLLDIGYPYKPGVAKLNHLTCTPDHKVLLDNGEYVAAGQLKVGDNVLMIAEVYDNSVLPIICGMLLGDSSIQDDKRSHCKLRINTTHGAAQIDYLQYKQTILGGSNMYEMKSGYCDNSVYRIYTIADAKVDAFLREHCWINGRKTITREFANMLNTQALAIWYMDDGCLKHKYDGMSPNIILSSNSFTKEENDILIDCLKQKFGIDCNLRSEKGYWSIYITTSGTPKFLEMVTPYIHPCLRYKTLERLEDEPFIGITPIARQTEIVPVEIKEIRAYNHSRHDRYVYDITVKDNHNFFAQGILTHNCENQPWRVGDGKTYLATEKLDGTSCTYALKKLPNKIFGKQKYEFYVCSRNVRQKDEDQKCYHDHNIYWDLAFKYDIEKWLKQFLEERPDCTWACIQGEGVGSVQGNPLKLKEDDLYVFNFITDVDGRWNSIDGKNLIEKFGMKWVPILGEVTLPDTMEALKETADGKSVVNPAVDREGIVYRSLDGKDSFKNVSRKYLLKHQNA